MQRESPTIQDAQSPRSHRSPDARLSAARRGDEGAVRALYEMHQPRLRRALRRVVGSDEAMIEDLVQETWLKAWPALRSFRGESALGTWLCRIAINTAISHSRRNRVPTVSDPDVLAIAASTAAPSPELTIDLERAVAALPKGMRTVLWLHDVEGWTHDQIGRRMAISAGTSKSQLFKARKKLRLQLTARYAA